MPYPQIYQVNDCDWWAGFSAASVKEAYRKSEMYDAEIAEEFADEPQPISEADMDRLKYCDDEDRRVETRTFRQQLERLVDQGQAFPVFFASTEY